MRTEIFLLLAVALLLAAGVGLAAETSPAWQLEWDKTIASAEKEGALSIYIFDAGPLTEATVQAFERAFPKIKVGQLRGRGNELGPRLIAEQHAGKHIADLFTGGVEINDADDDNFADRRPADKLFNEIFGKASK